MQCPRCLNTEESWFYKGSRGWYCRRCIAFKRAMPEEEEEAASLEDVREGSGEYMLKYPLTKAQKEVSQRCAVLCRTADVLLHCVCGAGKTELVLESMAGMLRERKKVCFAIPRRQVVLELSKRLAAYFPNAKVTAVCGGHTDETDGDLIICTTHQLYRYYRAFDLLILDEPDAFPYRGDPVLHGIAKTACRGHRIFLSATPDEEIQREVREGTVAELSLHVRPHGQPLPVPRIVVCSWILGAILLLKWISEHRNHPRMVFVPTVQGAKRMGRLLSLLEACAVCTGRSEDRDAVMEEFRKKEAGLIAATTVLERGITVAGCDICVWNADHAVFDEASLIQMAGRAGRSFEHPEGDVLFLCRSRSETAEACARKLREDNRYAVPVLP